jgi:hypothetical protein
MVYGAMFPYTWETYNVWRRLGEPWCAWTAPGSDVCSGVNAPTR